MSKTKAPRAHRYPEGWVVHTETRVNGRIVTPGTELKIRGERGRFRFIKQVTNANGVTWLDVVGGPAKHEMSRSFSPAQVKHVHRIQTTRANNQPAA